MDRVLTPERLRELLHYDPETGIFTWKIRNSVRINIGSVAGSRQKNEYLAIGVDGRSYYAHRLAWLYMTGKWPTDSLDHCDMQRTNNRFSNLREADHSKNGANRRVLRRSKSGIKGVFYNEKIKRWTVAIGTSGGYVGCFETPEEAREAYAKAAKARYGEFARTE